MSYADVNGLSLYYEEHGAGEPLVLLHGGFGAAELMQPIIPALAAGRRVIAVDLQGHGHTGDIDRPLRPEHMADDIAALIAHLGLERADVMGYSLGGMVALRTAIQHPERVRRLVVVSVAFRRDGSHPEVLEAMDQMGPAAGEPMRQSPLGQLYARTAPRPEDWPALVAKTADLLHHRLRLDGRDRGDDDAHAARVRRRGLDPAGPHRRVLRAARRRPPRRRVGPVAATGRAARDPPGHRRTTTSRCHRRSRRP